MPDAPHIAKYTEEFRQEELKRAQGSLFYFARAHLFFDRLHDLHYDLCCFLEGRPPTYRGWIRALVCAYRGSYKSTVCTQALPFWRGLFIENFSTKIIESNEDNVKKNHFIPMVDLFISSPQADYLQWLYQHRIPEGFKGWNTEQIIFKRTNPLASPAISYWGAESRKEGWHGNLIVCDDLEGADAEKSQAASADAWSIIGQCTPLLEEPRRDQVLVLGTPWGRSPLVWKIRELEEGGAIDAESQQKRTWQVWWRPILKTDGEPYEPERFPPNVIRALSKEPLWDDQYLLLKKRGRDIIFSEEAIRDYAFQYVDPQRTIIEYPGYTYDLDKLSEDGFVVPERELVRVHVQDLRTYLHADPTHKLDEQMRAQRYTRPSKHALVTVGVAPDGHAFPLEVWSEKCEIGDFVIEMMRMMRKYRVYRATYEAIGAQIWLPRFLEQYERMQRSAWVRSIHAGSSDRARLQQSMSSLLEEANKANESKEWIFRERLAPWVNHGILHFHVTRHHELIQQMLNVEDDNQSIDLIDALSQGPEIWESPIAASHRQKESFRRKAYALNVTKRRGVQYHPPWAAS